MNLLLCALGAYVLVQLLKLAILPKIIRSSTKLVMAMIGSFGISAALYAPKHTVYLVTYGLAGAGLAQIVHRLQRWFTVSADKTIRDLFRGR